jgi:predicted TIM-barrel fold metal-dependent hydrolase
MRNGYRFIDSDAHVIEPADMFEKYLEPKFRSPMPIAQTDYRGEPLAFSFKLVIPSASGGEYVMPFGRDPLDAAALARTGGASFDAGSPVALPGHDEAYAEFARHGFPPEMYKLAMERTGIDYMVVYPSAGLLTTAVPELAADTAAAYRRAYNNWLHDFCSAAGGRVFGAASVDLRDAEEAAREARRCVKEFDFKAVHINPVPVGEHRLYDDFYEPLWHALEDLNVPLAVHTGTGTAADEMLYHYLPRLRTAQTTVAFTIGNMLACTALIMGGVLERHPKLRVVHLESGAGWVAFWLDRLAASVQGGFRGLDIPGLKMHPIDYFQRQCYISADPDDPGIKQVIEVMGDNNLVTATDFSHPEGRRYAWAVKEMLELPGVSDESKRKIMWDNALKLYPIQADA